jgi:hypothetical protein
MIRITFLNYLTTDDTEPNIDLELVLQNHILILKKVLPNQKPDS